MPETAAAAYTWWATATVGTSTVLWSSVITTAIAVYGTVDAHSKARQRARDARAAHNAGLTDRTVSVMQADNPWQIIYGAPVVAPAVVATLTSGDRDEFKHLVVVWAAHECQAVQDIRLAGESIGTLDVDGYVTGGRWAPTVTETITDTLTANGSGVATLVRVPTLLMTVTAVYTTGSIPDLQTHEVPLEPTTHYTLSGTTLTLNGFGLPFVAAMTLRVTYDWQHANPMLRVRTHLGADDQTADTVLAAEVPTEWSTTDRGRGLCYSIFTFNLNEPEFQGGPPPITALVQGKRIYDPRADGTQPGGSGAQRADDPTTWVFSDNNALCTADFLRGRYGKNARTNQLLWASVVAAANVCDEDWDHETADEPRYTCNGSFRTADDPDGTLDQLCQSMAGFATFAGTWHVQAGSYTAPVLALTDADNAGAVEVVPAPAGDQVMNGMRGRYYNPSAYDQITDYVPYRNSAFVTEDGGEFFGSLDLPFTRSQSRCSHLVRIQVERSRGMQLVYPAKLTAYTLKPGQRITLTCGVLGITASVFRVVKREFAPGQAVKLTLQQDDPSYYDAFEAPATLPPPTQTGTNPFLVAAPVSLTADTSSGVVVRDDDGTVISRVRLEYAAATDVLVQNAGSLQIEFRLDAETAWQRHADAPGNSESTPLLGLQDELIYVVRARWRNSLGVVSDWRSVSVRPQGRSAAGTGVLPEYVAPDADFPLASNDFGTMAAIQSITPTVDCVLDLTIAFHGTCQTAWDYGVAYFACVCAPDDEFTYNAFYERMEFTGVPSERMRGATSGANTRQSYTITGRWDLTAGVTFSYGLLATGSHIFMGPNFPATVHQAVMNVTVIPR